MPADTWDYKEIVLPSDTSEKSVGDVLQEEAAAGWTLDRTEPNYHQDPAFKTYILKKQRSKESVEEKLEHDIEAGLVAAAGPPADGEPEAPGEKYAGPEDPPTYRPAGNF